MNNKTRKLKKTKKIKQRGGYIVGPTNPYFMAAAALIGGLYVLGQAQSSKTDAEPTSAHSQPQGQSGGRKFRRTRRRNKRKGGGNSKTRTSLTKPCGNKRKTRRKQKGGEIEISRLIKYLIDYSNVNSVWTDNQRHNLTNMIKTKIHVLPAYLDSTPEQQEVLMECMRVTRGPFIENSQTIGLNGEPIRIVYDPTVYIDTLPYQLQEIGAKLTSKFPDNMD
jgi:hypothetical protein